MTIPARRCLLAVVTAALLASAASCGSGAGPSSMEAAPGGSPPRSARPSAAPDTAPGGTAPGTSIAPAATAPPPTTAPTPSTTGLPLTTTPATTVAAGPAAVTTMTLPLVDRSRPTVSRGRTVRPERPLTTTVYLPQVVGPRPLVVFGHGFTLGPPSYERICRMLAAAGYVVAAPSFPLADQAVAGSNLDRGDLPNQAADVTFVLDQLLGPTAPAALAGRIDTGRIGMVGHSDGADVALDVGYVLGRSDPRVRAVVAVAPDAIPAPGAGTGTGVPLLVAHGDRDAVTPFSEGRRVFQQVSSHRFFVQLLGGDHLGIVQGAPPWTPVLDATIVAFLDRYVAGLGADDAAVRAAGTRPGVATVEVAG